jgi:hypothetical protein
MNESFSLGFFTIATIFIVVTMLVSYIVGWVFDFFDGMYRILSIIPFLKSINKLLGGALGFVEGVIFVIALQIFSQLYFAETSIGTALLDSTIMKSVSFATNIVSKLF